MRQLFAILTAIPLGACVVNTTAPPPTDRAHVCRADALPSFAGQQATANLGASILAASGARTIRWVPKGGMVTMEFSPERVTVLLDSANRVERASCG